MWTANTLGNDVEGVLYDGASAFTGNGNGLNNNLTGGRGADTLSGLAGNDALDGGAGFVMSTQDAMPACTTTCRLRYRYLLDQAARETLVECEG